ncbi:MAG TPA: tetratricopeptide repeat protein [Rectinema sp.]|nr:tetratricopeptide repeat protein [Spirochaetota bacterium]HNV36043.1 tetratricopeptide repeat protein [Rectinema sp.]HOC26557.1 tetratricopeptide repeat protein [Rectinema sp.]HOE98583.1 tetratricopeptide repeat protein [Rectinema sp.]HOH15972.1 tetratricopeptide repeat protein [Rectinema sp.]
MNQEEMQQEQHNKEEKKSSSERFVDFISKNRRIIIGLGIAIVLIIVAIGIYTAVSGNIASASSRAMELADQKALQWSQETDEEKRAEIESSLIAELDSIAQKWPRTLAAQRALLRKAALLSQKKEYAEAEKTALEAYRRNKKSYVAPIALELAAVAAEEAGNTDAALEHYTLITKDYKKDNPAAAHAFFNLGRIKEAKGDYKGAIEAYNQLIASFGDSEWAMLAKNRVIYLNAQGLAG